MNNQGADQTADVQAGLRLCCAQTPKTGFLVSRPLSWPAVICLLNWCILVGGAMDQKLPLSLHPYFDYLYQKKVMMYIKSKGIKRRTKWKENLCPYAFLCCKGPKLKLMLNIKHKEN